MDRVGETAVSARFDVEYVVVAMAIEAAALVALTEVMVGAVAVPAVAIMTVDSLAAILGGNQPKNGCEGVVW